MSSAATLVIKYGGSLLDDPAHRAAFLKDISALPKSPRVILVHGGGKEISRHMEKAGLTPRFVNGRRFTDEATMTVVESALKDLNAEMVKSLKTLGVEARGYSGRDHHLMEATTVPDLGRVGLPAKIDAAALKTILSDPAMPVFYSVAEDAGHQPLNINADDVALALAVALQASRLIYLTDTGGLLGRDGKLISKIYEQEVDALIKDGTVTGGMLVKVKACLDALKQGVGLVDLEKDVKFLQVKQMFSNGTTIALRKPVSL